ncbi:hypothetical protein B0H14DRAFT_2586560 [Mycena olivaceomarginata]|nr:hypothetical protein B0H14DRAFT_2586560 [Mycena olivaceomarginata]
MPSFRLARACPGPGLIDTLSADVSRLEMTHTSLLVLISLSIRRLIGNHRGSAFRGFDAYVGATTVYFVNISPCLRSLFALVLGRVFMLYVWYSCGLLPRNVKMRIALRGRKPQKYSTTYTTRN